MPAHPASPSSPRLQLLHLQGSPRRVPTREPWRPQPWAVQPWGTRVTAFAFLFVGCGAPVPEEESESLRQPITGGYVDDATSGVVGLGIFEQDHFFVGHCSGTLIAPNLVLTARHCVTQFSVEEDASLVTCGETDFERTRNASSIVVSPETKRPDNPLDPSFVRGATVHPVPGADDVCGYDVALVVLERSLREDEAVPIVPRIDEAVTANETFSSQGYGLTADREDASSGLRMRLDDNEVLCSPAQCAQEHPEVVKDTEWVSADAGVCSGDSGGPALDSAGRVIGVASRGGEDCKATIYGGVEAWSDFIVEIALHAAEVGDYPPPFWTSGTSIEPQSGDDDEEAVILDEPSDNVSQHGDLECSADCAESSTLLPAESSCALSPSRASGSASWLALTALALALGRRRLLKRSGTSPFARRPAKAPPRGV